MTKPPLQNLSRRERQVLEAIYRLDNATARAVQEELPDPPSYSAVRTHLRILEEKGHVCHEEEGRRYVYHPTVGKRKARSSALRGLLDTFFDGSVTATVAALIDEGERTLTEEELAELEALVREARTREDR